MNGDAEKEDLKEDLHEKHYPPVEVAEARIEQALLKYAVSVDKATPPKKESKVRL